MKDTDCIRFLQWALPQNHMRWSGFRRVRGQVCKRLAKRLSELNLDNLTDYQDYLSQQQHEWKIFDNLCRVTISRFYRDKLVFAKLAEHILPALATQAQSTDDKTIRIWSIGCSSGEEPYTLAILWQHLLAQRFPAVCFYVRASEADAELLKRCQQACYPFSSVKNLPEAMRSTAFVQDNDQYYLKAEYKNFVEFVQEDIRMAMPEDQFDVILCRNLVFTYFDAVQQQKTLQQLYIRLHPHGWLVLGVHEQLPANSHGFLALSARLGLYLKQSEATVSA